MATVSERHAGGRPRTLKRCALGEKIERLATAKGLHMDELAKKVGIATPSLYRILTGEISSPRLSTFKSLAKALGVTLEKLA